MAGSLGKVLMFEKGPSNHLRDEVVSVRKEPVEGIQADP
jgi:hypothetical protein